MRDTDTCHFVYPEGDDPIFIPGCWATIHGDQEACTCRVEGSRLERAIAAKTLAEKLADSLRLKLTYHMQRCRKLQESNYELRAAAFEMKRGQS
jgi:hypothetical protein